MMNEPVQVLRQRPVTGEDPVKVKRIRAVLRERKKIN